MAWLSRMGLKRHPGIIWAAGGEPQLTGPMLDLDTIRLAPDNTFIQGHLPADTPALDRFLIVTVFRDPRNVLVSYVRQRRNIDRIHMTLPEAMQDFWGKPFVQAYRAYLDWRGRCIVLRYENLEPAHVGLGSGIYTPDRPDWDKWIGNTRTGSPSYWQEHWTQDVVEAWAEAGGEELLEASGYEHGAP